MPIPQIKRGEVLLRMSHGGICGSDIQEESMRDAIHRVFGDRGVYDIFECATTEVSFTEALPNAQLKCVIAFYGKMSSC